MFWQLSNERFDFLPLHLNLSCSGKRNCLKHSCNVFHNRCSSTSCYRCLFPVRIWSLRSWNLNYSNTTSCSKHNCSGSRNRCSSKKLYSNRTYIDRTCSYSSWNGKQHMPYPRPLEDLLPSLQKDFRPSKLSKRQTNRTRIISKSFFTPYHAMSKLKRHRSKPFWS